MKDVVEWNSLLANTDNKNDPKHQLSKATRSHMWSSCRTNCSGKKKTEAERNLEQAAQARQNWKDQEAHLPPPWKTTAAAEDSVLTSTQWSAEELASGKHHNSPLPHSSAWTWQSWQWREWAHSLFPLALWTVRKKRRRHPHAHVVHICTSCALVSLSVLQESMSRSLVSFAQVGISCCKRPLWWDWMISCWCLQKKVFVRVTSHWDISRTPCNGYTGASGHRAQYWL